MKWGVITLVTALLIAPYLVIVHQAFLAGQASARERSLQSTADNYRQVSEELRQVSRDISTILASVRTGEQQRNEQGELRREQLRETISADSCSSAVVPAALADSLRKRTSSGHRTCDPAVRTASGSADESDPHSGTPLPSDMGQFCTVE